MEARYYSFNTMFRSLKDELGAFLKGAKIYYELSGRYAGWHFEIFATPQEADAINEWLDRNTFTEEKA